MISSELLPHNEKENFFNHGYVYLILKYYKRKRLQILYTRFRSLLRST